MNFQISKKVTSDDERREQEGQGPRGDWLFPALADRMAALDRMVARAARAQPPAPMPAPVPAQAPPEVPARVAPPKVQVPPRAGPQPVPRREHGESLL